MGVREQTLSRTEVPADKKLDHARIIHHDECVQNLERQLERFVPLGEASSSSVLHDLSRMELDYFRNRTENPELELLLSGCSNGQQREAVLSLSTRSLMATKKGFAAKFAVLLHAHAAALRGTPERILAAVQPLLSEHERNVADAAARASQACGDLKEQVGAALEAQAQLRELVTQGRATEIAARDQFFQAVAAESRKVTDAAADILSISEKRIALGLLISYLLGIVTWLAVEGFFRWVSRLF
jgi:hypothetical protein